MDLLVEAVTDVKDTWIDFIEIKLASGEVVLVDWETTDSASTEKGFSACYKGLSFSGEYADGCLDELKGVQLEYVEALSDSCSKMGVDPELKFLEMTFEDFGVEETFRFWPDPNNPGKWLGENSILGLGMNVRDFSLNKNETLSFSGSDENNVQDRGKYHEADYGRYDPYQNVDSSDLEALMNEGREIAEDLAKNQDGFEKDRGRVDGRDER